MGRETNEMAVAYQFSIHDFRFPTLSPVGCDLHSLHIIYYP
jgi:hypothetical protein